MGWVDKVPLRIAPRRQRTVEQKARAKRRQARDQKWRKANRIRATWTDEEKQAEELRLEAEIAAMLAAQKAA